jgi:hypothetical protein
VSLLRVKEREKLLLNLVKRVEKLEKVNQKTAAKTKTTAK